MARHEARRKTREIRFKDVVQEDMKSVAVREEDSGDRVTWRVDLW